MDAFGSRRRAALAITWIATLGPVALWLGAIGRGGIASGAASIEPEQVPSCLLLSCLSLGPYLLVAATGWIVRRDARRARIAAAIAVLVALVGAVGWALQRARDDPGHPLFVLGCTAAVQVSLWVLGAVAASTGPHRDPPAPTRVS